MSKQVKTYKRGRQAIKRYYRISDDWYNSIERKGLNFEDFLSEKPYFVTSTKSKVRQVGSSLVR